MFLLADCLLGAIDVKGRDIYLATSYSSLLVERRLEGDESLWVDPGGALCYRFSLSSASAYHLICPALGRVSSPSMPGPSPAFAPSVGPDD